ncbi:MAG: hypothetical protein NC115_04620 [Bacteroidales bacterium]|nr:hypothetical protein [Bacteroides sp.]MCM1197274.1 hypothetical protein [Clostridium sp.]MCM1501936.1 hypothetical protein [Bacteroidales bacterium]
MGFIIILMTVGILLILAEIFLLPGIGMTGVIGFVCLAISCACSFDILGAVSGIIVTAISSLLFVALIFYALRVKSWRRFMFHGTKGIGEDSIGIGDKGRTVTRLAPSGTARFGNELYEVKALEGKIPQETDVEIVLIENNRITVRRVGPEF